MLGKPLRKRLKTPQYVAAKINRTFADVVNFLILLP